MTLLKPLDYYCENYRLIGQMEMIKSLLSSIRPKQWTKNSFLFAGLVFAQDLFDQQKVLVALGAFILFCLLSSSVYLVNDLVDMEKDRQHPRKRFRPLASGKLSVKLAIITTILLLGISLPLSFYIGLAFGTVALIYFLLSLAYSFFLKNMIIIDVFVIAAGFVLRAMAGALAIDVKISPWLYVCTVLLALFLALSKRRHEMILLSDGAINHRRIFEDYSTPLLEEMISVVTSSTVLAYSIYTFSAENLPPNKFMMFTIPFVIYAVFRYLYLVYQRDEGGTPEELVLKDIPLIIDIFLWIVASVAILYFFNR